MMEKVININRKSFLALILTLIILFSTLAPTISLATNENIITEENINEKIAELKDQVAEKEAKEGVVGEIIDFSNEKQFDFKENKTIVSKSMSEYGIDFGGYTIKKEGDNYTIILDNLTAKKLILPADVADEKGKEVVDENGEKYYVPAYTGEARKTTITINIK